MAVCEVSAAYCERRDGGSIAPRARAYQLTIATSRLGCTFQEIYCLSDMLQRLFNRAAASLSLPGMCCYSTEAVVQNLGRRAEIFAFVSR